MVMVQRYTFLGCLFILRRLYNDRRIGGRHTAEDHLKKGIPPNFQKYTAKAIKGLVNKGLIVKKQQIMVHKCI